MGLRISNSPHIWTSESTRKIMLDVIIALLPTTIVGVYLFGFDAALVVLLSTASCVLTEYVCQKIMKRPVTINDLSAVVTGILLGLNLPSSLIKEGYWWLPIIGGIVAIALAKQIFGGLGDNFLNPALTARAVLLTSWPVAMTTFYTIDGVTSATVLSEAGFNATHLQMFMGTIPGTIGEVSKIAILVGFVYLLIRKVISWHIPVIFTATTALLTFVMGDGSGAFTGDVLTTVLSGGLLLGAVFMATDYTTNPMTKKGHVIFAVGCGLLTAIIRRFGSFPEGVSYSILIMNIITPLIDKYVQPKLYGEVKKNA